MFSGYEANDGRRLVEYIIDELHDELNINYNNKPDYSKSYNSFSFQSMYNKEIYLFQTLNKSIIEELFYGIEEHTFKCKNCEKEKFAYEHFSILNLPIILKKKRNNRYYLNYLSLNEMLNDYYREYESEGEYQMKCTNCKKICDFINITKLAQPPKYLIIHLARETFGPTQSIEIGFNENLDLSQFISKYTNSEFHNYELIGVLCHIGLSGNYGHYISHCKNSGYWFKYNDTKVNESSFEDINKRNV